MSNNIVKLTLESNSYEKGIRQAQKQWESFTRSLGVNLGKFTAIGVAAGAVTGALKVAKDAFFKNEQQLDEWNRTVKSAESLYSGFLNALNTGSIQGYLQNINNIVSAARQAYDALDELNTYNAFNQGNYSQARANLTGAMADYREGLGSKENVRAAATAYQQFLEERRSKEMNAYEKAVRDIAQDRQVSGDVLLRILQGSNEQYEQYKKLPLTGQKVSYQGFGMPGALSTSYEPAPANEQEKMGEVLRSINDTGELDVVQALLAKALQTSEEINQTRKSVARILNGSSGVGGGAASSATAKQEYIPLAGSIDAQVQKVKELQEAFNAAGSDGIRMGLLPQLKEAEQTLERMRTIGDFMATAPTGIPGTELSPVAAPKLDDSELEKAKALAEIAEKNRQAWMNAASAIGSVGQALQNIESPAAKVVGIIAEAVANVALAFANSLKGTFDPWEFIAGAAAGTATMIATIAAIKQATAGSYATGGIVPGNNYQDGLMARVSSGELILNQAQQGTLATRLQQGSMLQNMHLEATLSGEDMRIAITNNLRRSGSGETINLRLQ